MKRCRRVKQEINEEQMEIEGEFPTLSDMKEKAFSELLACIQ